MEKLPHIEAKKSLGQHFLNNARVPKAMAAAGNVHEGDVVLEIGPGTGALTQALLACGATVVAIEADLRAIEALSTAFSEEIRVKKLVLIHGDIREMALASLAPTIKNGTYKVVANIPYYLSGLLFRTFLETDVQPSDLVFLVQREVGERICRDPKESLLSLSVKVFGDPKYIETIGKGDFTPPPKVDSAIIAVYAISKDRLSGIPEAVFFHILHLGLAAKRKQLMGNLAKQFPRKLLVHIFSTLNLKEDIRGEDVSLSDWVSLVTLLSPHMASR